MVKELELALVGDSAAAPPARILEALSAELALRRVAHAPHTIYAELWHITFWQQMTLNWIRGEETAFPTHPDEGFPTQEQVERESWEALRERFFSGNRQAGAAAANMSRLEQEIRCPSRPGVPVRVMTVREQLESLVAHNAYHFGRIVLLRQLHEAWPPPSGGFRW